MRFYRVSYSNQHGIRYDWFLLRREAQVGARKFLRALGDPSARVNVEPIDIPGTRQAMLAALRKFARRGD